MGQARRRDSDVPDRIRRDHRGSAHLRLRLGLVALALVAADFHHGHPTSEGAAALHDELLHQHATQAYLWALPALDLYAMKEASEARFGKGYAVLPIWKKRLDAKTLVTTPSSDVLYAMGYLDLAADGPLVIEAPPGLQGVLDDFFARPICSVPGPDKGKGGKYLVLPPDYRGKPPGGYLTCRSRTYGVFVLWRGFFQDPKRLEGPVRVMEQTVIYPLGKKAGAKKMEFPDASGVPIDMLPPRDSSAFDMLKRFIDGEYVDPRDLDMRGMLAALGIVKGEPFAPDSRTRAILEKAAKRASEMSRYAAMTLGDRPGAKDYPDRQWVNALPPTSGTPTYTDVEQRNGFFSLDAGASCLSTFKDADGEYFEGDRSYELVLPAGIPVKLFWSVTAYDAETAAGLDNGQPFPSLSQMDGPVTAADGSTEIYFGPKSPGAGKNWIATVPGKGFFVALRLYAPTQAFLDKTWRPGDLRRVR